VRLKTELHRIIGVLAAGAFFVIGVLAFFSVRWFHRVEYVEARGVLLAQVLASSCAEKLEGPSPVPDLYRYLGRQVRSVDAGKDVEIISAVVLGADGDVMVQRGATSLEHQPDEPHIQSAFSASDPRAVTIEWGGVRGRTSRHGEEVVEFALPLINDAGRHLGVLVVSMEAEVARATMIRTVSIILAGAAPVIGLLWLLLFNMLKGRILTPILVLTKGIERVRGGDLTARVEIYRRDEIGTLVESFNDLIAVLVERDSLTARLEEANRLEEAHSKLNEAHRQLKAAHEQLLITEKHASIGRLVHGLNHELNNPLSAAQNMIPPLTTALNDLRSALTLAVAPEASGSADDEALVASTTSSDVHESGDETTPSDHEESTAEPVAPAAQEEVAESLEDAAKAVEVLARSVRRAINIVHDLGGFSKLSSADLETVELRAVVDDALAACERELGPDDRIAVSVDIPAVEGAPLTLKAFPNLLTQVFVNLITNSAQAVEGPGKVRIWAKVLPEGRVRVELDDNGPGIAKENLSKVFEPFFTTKEQGKGTGLGLSLCLGIIQKHGGTIGVKRKWRGAHFVVEVPLEARVETKDPFGSAAFLSTSTTVLG
jgi:signal transduction histidine kinase